MDADALWLSMLRAFPGMGSVCARTSSGAFDCIFDRQYIGDGVGDLDVESRTPALTCRTSDVERLQLKKGVLVDVPDGTYKIRRHEPDGTGMSMLILEKP